MKKRSWPIAAIIVIFLLIIIILGGMIVFGVAPRPKPIASLNAPEEQVDLKDLPALAHYPARDGARLGFRAYPSAGKDAAVLIHGVISESSIMHALAKTISQAGMTAYSLDLRGHGGQGRSGDIDYIGQLDDDLTDFVKWVRKLKPKARITLIGHSAGGGLALRFAEGPYGGLFDRYLLLSPALDRTAPTYRPNAGGLASPYIPRIIALTILNRFGIHWFDGLPVIAFAAPQNGPTIVTPIYSFRLQTNFTAPGSYLADLPKVKKPISLIVGQADEVFYPEKFAPLLNPIRPDVPIVLLPEITHTGIVTVPKAIKAITAALGPIEN